MLDILFWILVGVVIGWNLPQPVWAVYLQTKLSNLIKGILAKVQ